MENTTINPANPDTSSIREGTTLHDVKACEDHVVLKVEEGGYLLIQYEAMKRAGLAAGKNTIHVSEVDGVHIKIISL